MTYYHVEEGKVIAVVENAALSRLPLVPGDGGATPANRPEINERTHKVSLVPVYDPELKVVRETWVVEALSEDELKRIEEAAWYHVRSRRDGLLMASDWRMLPDSPLTPEERATWAAYRAALRDITKQFSDPDAVVWPETPQ